MGIGRDRFNTYLRMALGLAVAVALGASCRSPETKRKKSLATLRIQLETNPDATGHTESVPVSRDQPFMITVQKSPFLTQADIKQASVIEVIGGFALKLQFDRHGALVLEQYSTANLGRRFAIFGQFAAPPEEKLNQGRWLGAPRITRRISDGVLVFTPDASREETDTLAMGLNNVAKKLKKDSEDTSL